MLFLPPSDVGGQTSRVAVISHLVDLKIADKEALLLLGGHTL